MDDKNIPFVFISFIQKQVYLRDIDKLNKKEIIFLFYELFPLSKLKNFRDWYEFGFESIKKEIKMLYKRQIYLVKNYKKNSL